jgi:hypothetical protein
VALTPEFERYTRSLHKKLNLMFDMLTDRHLKTAEQFRLVFALPDYLRDLYKSFGAALDRFHETAHRCATTYRHSRCMALGLPFIEPSRATATGGG